MCYNLTMKYDIVIIGAGIAGLTAAIYAKRASKNVIVFESLACGGQAMQTDKIKNYPGFEEISGPELTEKIYHQVNNLGVKIHSEEVASCKKEGANFAIKTDEGEYTAKAVIIATGAKDKPMGAKNELKMVGKGVSYCAACDGALYYGKAVAVVGGGNSGLYAALYLADIAEKVYLLNRGAEFNGEQMMMEALKNKPNVEFVLNATVAEVLGSENVEGLKIKSAKGEEILPVEGVFVNVGKAPNTGIFQNLVKLDEFGYVIAGEDCRTSCSLVYVAGDCRTKGLRQLVTAAADGAVAASMAVQNLR
jgi:thioredoxin reductase (NADPH)